MSNDEHVEAGSGTAVRINRIREAFAEVSDADAASEDELKPGPKSSWRNGFDQGTPWKNTFNQGNPWKNTFNQQTPWRNS